jgi:hypothetical protein
MAKAAFGDYSAFTTKNSVRYQLHNKLISQSDVPAEVVGYLNKQLGYEPKPVEAPVQKFPRPTEEQLAKMRAESLEVPEHLQRQEPLTPEDFSTEDIAELLPADSNGNEPLPRTDTPARPVVEPDFLESVSIHTATLADIAEALYNRFGIYSVYLGSLPQADEINPLTGEVFSKYHLGIAYQASIRAQHTGVAERANEQGRKDIDAGRAASENFLDTFVPAPATMAEARRADSFEYRTSPQGTRSQAATEVVHITDENGIVHAVQREIPAGSTGEFNGAKAQYDAEEDQPLVVPQFGKQVIRPNW